MPELHPEPGQNNRLGYAQPPPAMVMPATLGWGPGQLVPTHVCAPQQGKEHHKLILTDGLPSPYTPCRCALVKHFYQLYIYGMSYMNNSHIPKRPVKPGALLAAGQDLQLRVDPTSTETASPLHSLALQFPLPSHLGPTFGRQREDLITPLMGISPPGPLSGFRKPQRLFIPRGRAAISPFCL